MCACVCVFEIFNKTNISEMLKSFKNNYNTTFSAVFERHTWKYTPYM